MLRTVLQLALGASFAAIILPASAVDIDLVNRTTIAVPLGATGNSFGARGVSDDGRYALFFSEANNHIAGDTNQAIDLFLYDHQNGTTERVNLGNGNVQANADTVLMADLSADARYVVFESRATNLVTADTHGTWQIYLRDRVAQTTVLVSRGLDGSGTATGGYQPKISADGRYVVFASYDRLVEHDFNFANDVYRYDRVGGLIELISTAPTGEPGNLGSEEARISADGRYVAFRSAATNLFPGDTNVADDIVLRDTVANINLTASLTTAGGQFPGFRTLASGNALTADGRYVLFNTNRALDPADTNGAVDGFRYDRTTGIVDRVTLGPGGALLDYGANARALSDDGTVVLMESSGADLVAGTTADYRRHYARTIASGAITLVKLRPGPIVPNEQTQDCDLSGDGSTAYCDSSDMNFIDDNGYKLFFRSTIGADSGVRVSRSLPTPVAAADGYSGGLVAGASDDGRYVAFESGASNLVVGDHNDEADVFLRDRLAGTTQRISRTFSGGEAACASGAPRMTPDGRYVVFLSCGALLEPAAGATVQVYRYDRVADNLQLVSINGAGLPCNAHCLDPSISDDGNVIAFASSATNLGQTPPPNGGVFLRRLPGGAPVLVNRPNGGGIADSGPPSRPQISGSGRFVHFSDMSTNLVAGDTNSVVDVFAFDADAGILQRASLGPAGQQLTTDSWFAGVSRDGSRVLFRNANLVCPSAGYGLHVRDTLSGQVDCVSRDGTNSTIYEIANSAAISADGNRIAFTTFLSPPPYVTPVVETVVLHDRTTQRVHRIAPPYMNGDARVLHLCADGDCLLFSSTASNVVADDPNGHIMDVFIAQDLTSNRLFADGFEAR